ncbi:hypothetical protein B7494_g6823 [Chlorociboria aeruginascens]|nr:hypothetical protein B7494_g6823 [Chlorociboria aeruginascens]
MDSVEDWGSQPLLFNSTDPFPALTITTVSFTAFVTQPTTITRSQSISTTDTVTNIIMTTPSPTLDLDETTALLQSNAAFTRTAFIITWSLVGFAIFLILLLVVFFFFWVRRCRKFQKRSPAPPEQEDNTPTAPQSFQMTRVQSAPLSMTGEGRETYLSMGPQTLSSGVAHGAQSSQNSPPARPLRPPSSQTMLSNVTPPHIPLTNFSFPAFNFEIPQISIQPNSPSIVRRDHSSNSPPLSPIAPIGSARSLGAPLFYSDIGHERDERREREEWLGVPTPQERRQSTSTMASEFIPGIALSEDEVHDEGRAVTLHSTRASSSVFPD